MHLRDANGETIFDDMKDPATRKMIARACGVWAVENADLFPTDFRQATLTLALIGKRQHVLWQQEKSRVHREVALTKQTLQREFAETKVRYDELLRHCNMAPSVLKKLSALEEADERFDCERRSILIRLQDAVDSLRQSEQPRFLAERVICTILSFCSRHWFERAHKHRSRRKKDQTKVHKTVIKLEILPTRSRAPPDQLPYDVRDEWESFQRELKVFFSRLYSSEPHGSLSMYPQSTRASLSSAIAIECFDAESGVSKDVESTSLAELDVCVIEAERLPWRDPRIEDMVHHPYRRNSTCTFGLLLTSCCVQMDPFVRVYLRSGKAIPDSQKPVPRVFDSAIRIGTRDPVWDFHCRIESVPSIHCELVVQIVDQKRNEPAGEVHVPLRSLLNQREHDLWLVIPPTLRQQVLEKSPRAVPARLHVIVMFSHTRVRCAARPLTRYSV